jgi:hypothetical protein
MFEEGRPKLLVGGSELTISNSNVDQSPDGVSGRVQRAPRRSLA